MRMLLLAGWLLLPLGFAAYHYGPGQDRLRRDGAANTIAEADRAVAAGEYAEAAQRYQEALGELPESDVTESRRVRLELAKAQMLSAQLPEAHVGLKELADDLTGATPEFTRDVHTALAASSYYLTWMLRLEGVSRDEWEPEIEASRQLYKRLAEETGDPARREDLEAAVRLARLDLEELQGLSLPKQCQGCKNCAGKCKGGKCKKPGKGNGQKPPEDARGASSGKPVDGSGH